MMYKSYVMAVILSLAGLLLTTDVVQARCNGCRGGCYGGCYGCYGGGGCYRSCGCYGGGYRGCYGGSYGCYGGGCYGGYSRGCYGCYGGGYQGGGHHGGYAGTYTYHAGIATGTTYVASSSPAAPTNVATVRVILPDSQATVWVDGSRTSSTGAVRVYQTPELSTGGTYTIKASWMTEGREVTNERNVTVAAGQTSVVDFNQARAVSEVATRP